jgi:16S rRNA (guanine1207-N2)-methyltransferase
VEDLAIALLIRQLQQTPRKEPCLWFADENSLYFLPLLARYSAHLTVLTNRFDIHTAAKALGLSSYFNDVNLPIAVGVTAPRHIFARVSKEKSVTHHLANQAIQVLAQDGQFHIAGYKSEGVKSYIKKISELFTLTSTIEKNKEAYLGSFLQPNKAQKDLLDTQQYPELREIGQFDQLKLISKPGVFGYQKIDQGSVLLLATTKAYLTKTKFNPQTQLDLGCGYGLLTLASAHWGKAALTATDNSAAALAAMAAGAAENNINVTLLPSDAGAELTTPFDLILCNPPFHQGFSISGDLTDKFLANSAKLLQPNGIAIFVVNSFVGLEKKAVPYYGHQETLVNTNKFKVIAFTQARNFRPNNS